MKITLPSRSVRIAQALHKRRKLPNWAGILPATLGAKRERANKRASDGWGAAETRATQSLTASSLTPYHDEHLTWCCFDISKKVEAPTFETVCLLSFQGHRSSFFSTVTPNRFQNSYSFASPTWYPSLQLMHYVR
jgi:hypothetical protein